MLVRSRRANHFLEEAKPGKAAFWQESESEFECTHLQKLQLWISQPDWSAPGASEEAEVLSCYQLYSQGGNVTAPQRDETSRQLTSSNIIQTFRNFKIKMCSSGVYFLFCCLQETWRESAWKKSATTKRPERFSSRTIKRYKPCMCYSDFVCVTSLKSSRSNLPFFCSTKLSGHLLEDLSGWVLEKQFVRVKHLTVLNAIYAISALTLSFFHQLKTQLLISDNQSFKIVFMIFKLFFVRFFFFCTATVYLDEGWVNMNKVHNRSQRQRDRQTHRNT